MKYLIKSLSAARSYIQKCQVINRLASSKYRDFFERRVTIVKRLRIFNITRRLINSESYISILLKNLFSRV